MKTITVPVTTIERLLDGLVSAQNVCLSVDYSSDDYEKSAPFAVGYSKATISCMIDDLRHLID
jgi:hypothetical protein